MISLPTLNAMIVHNLTAIWSIFYKYIYSIYWNQL